MTTQPAPSAAAARWDAAPPQYRRMNVEGCICSTGAAGGACCSGGAAGVVGGGHGHGAAVPAVVGFLGAVGIVGGARAMRGAGDALRDLREVRAVLAQEHGTRRRAVEQAGLGSTTSAAQANRLRADAAELLLRHVDQSMREQRFHQAVPGGLQLTAATAAILESAGHVAVGTLGIAAGGCLAGAGSALFGLYGAVMALKSLSNLCRDRHDGAPGGISRIYAAALRAHQRGRRSEAAWSAAAWTLVAAAGVLGTLLGAGLLAGTAVAGVAVGLAVAGAAGSMLAARSTRYLPHFPVAAYALRGLLAIPQSRETALLHLRAQDAALKEAVANLVAEQGAQVRYGWEQLTKPQCGPTAFQTLARHGGGEAAQVQALRAYCVHEIALLDLRLQGVAAQEDAAAAALLWQRRDGWLDVQKGLASCDPDAALEQQTWAALRLQVLLLSGTLGEAVSPELYAAHPAFFGKSRAPGSLPLGQLYVLPEQRDAFVAALTPDLDRAFIHAFFNPRRLEAQVDFVLDLELRSASTQVAVCHTGACCK